MYVYILCVYIYWLVWTCSCSCDIITCINYDGAFAKLHPTGKVLVIWLFPFFNAHKQYVPI